MPTHLGLLSRLRKLRLQNNVLSGTMSTRKLTYVDLHAHANGRCCLQPNSRQLLTAVMWCVPSLCTGPVPTEFGKMSNLRTMFLGNNRLTGMCMLTHYFVWYLFVHIITCMRCGLGPIPSELGLLSLLSSLYLNENVLTGKICLIIVSFGSDATIILIVWWYRNNWYTWTVHT